MSDALGPLGAAFGLDAPGMASTEAALGLLGILRPQLAFPEAATLAVVASFLGRSGISEAAKTTVLSELSGGPLQGTSVSVLDGATLAIRTPTATSFRDLRTLKVTGDPVRAKGTPFTIVVFDVSRFYEVIQPLCPQEP